MIFIFGDSYGDPNKRRVMHGNKHHEFISQGPFWYNYLAEYEPTNNYCKSATGPYYSFDKFYHCYENDLLKRGDKIVFILSSPHRIGNNNLGDMVLSKSDVEYYNKVREEFDFDVNNIEVVYKILQREIDFINFKNVTFLKFFSQLNESKIIVFRAFDNKSFNIDTEEYPEHLYDLSILNDENFYYYPEVLFDITVNELLEKEPQRVHDWGEVNKNKVDVGRTNHLTEYNHKILSNVILNFFFDTELDETFKKNFYEKQFVNEFIYDE